MSRTVEMTRTFWPYAQITGMETVERGALLGRWMTKVLGIAPGPDQDALSALTRDEARPLLAEFWAREAEDKAASERLAEAEVAARAEDPRFGERCCNRWRARAGLEAIQHRAISCVGTHYWSAIMRGRHPSRCGLLVGDSHVVRTESPSLSRLGGLLSCEKWRSEPIRTWT